MKANRFTTEQIIGILKEADSGMPVKELCRKYGMSDVSLYNWKAKYGGMAVSEARRLKDLEEEKRRLKKLVTDQTLDIKMLKEITKKVVTLEAKRKTVKHLQERFGQSRQRICRLVGLSLSTWHYKAKPDDNPQIRQRLRDLAGERRRWGGIEKSMRYSEEKASSLTINERRNFIGKRICSLKPEDARKLLQL